LTDDTFLPPLVELYDELGRQAATQPGSAGALHALLRIASQHGHRELRDIAAAVADTLSLPYA
jgi:hypothetical protein